METRNDANLKTEKLGLKQFEANIQIRLVCELKLGIDENKFGTGIRSRHISWSRSCNQMLKR